MFWHWKVAYTDDSVPVPAVSSRLRDCEVQLRHVRTEIRERRGHDFAVGQQGSRNEAYPPTHC